MTAESLVEKFERLSELDADSWAKKTWPSEEDIACKKLIAELGGFDVEKRVQLSNKIRSLSLDRQLEVFAFRSGKSATSRRDIEDAYRSVLLCQSKERLRIESSLVEFARVIGVNGRKVKRELAT